MSERVCVRGREWVRESVCLSEKDSFFFLFVFVVSPLSFFGFGFARRLNICDITKFLRDVKTTSSVAWNFSQVWPNHHSHLRCISEATSARTTTTRQSKAKEEWWSGVWCVHLTREQASKEVKRHSTNNLERAPWTWVWGDNQIQEKHTDKMGKGLKFHVSLTIQSLSAVPYHNGTW